MVLKKLKRYTRYRMTMYFVAIYHGCLPVASHFLRVLLVGVPSTQKRLHDVLLGEQIIFGPPYGCGTHVLVYTFAHWQTPPYLVWYFPIWGLSQSGMQCDLRIVARHQSREKKNGPTRVQSWESAESFLFWKLRQKFNRSNISPSCKFELIWISRAGGQAYPNPVTPL